MNNKLGKDFLEETGGDAILFGIDDSLKDYIKWLEDKVEASRVAPPSLSEIDNSDLITKALSIYGLTEIQGSLDEPLIIEMFAVSGHSWVRNDETAWCAAFLNWVAILCGFEATRKLNARSFLNIGEKIKSSELKLGDVLIFSRGNPTGWQGHVCFYIAENELYYYCLGGNQSNQVNISKYRKSRFLGGRRLKRVISK